MRFSNREQYGLRAMVEFARRYGSGPVSLGDIALSQDISLSYLEQIVIPLRKAGLLSSRRGASGGYCLVAPPVEVTAGDVIRALEGPLVPVRCVTVAGSAACCEREGSCAARTVWRKVADRLEEALDSTTLADLIA
jgi:Rrf2 family transcriptional regulator, cysteine metabolism repressor